MKRLQRKAHCIIYDHRGYGGRKDAHQETVTIERLASDLNELIEGLSPSDVTLVGWSMGESVAMTYIRNFGCFALRQVVLCDMTPKQINDTEWKLGLYQEDIQKKIWKGMTGRIFCIYIICLQLVQCQKQRGFPHL